MLNLRLRDDSIQPTPTAAEVLWPKKHPPSAHFLPGVFSVSISRRHVTPRPKYPSAREAGREGSGPDWRCGGEITAPPRAERWQRRRNVRKGIKKRQQRHHLQTQALPLPAACLRCLTPLPALSYLSAEALLIAAALPLAPPGAGSLMH